MTPEQRIDRRVGKNIKAIRTSQGKSQGDLASALGITFQQVQKYEAGTNRVSASKLVLLSRYLGVGIVDLFTGIKGVEGGDGLAAD